MQKCTLAAKNAISAYLTRFFDTKPTIYGLNCPKGGISTNDAEFFAPWRLVAAQEQHGDIGYWNRVTDQNYEDGRYYKTIPEPPAVHIVDFTGYDGPLDENGFPVGLPDEIARYAKEQGAAPDAPQIILKRNAPPEPENLNEK